MKSFQNFYRGFLNWGLDAGADVRPADHAFYFSAHDSNQFGDTEHLGLMGNCGEQTCKIQAKDLDPPLPGTSVMEPQSAQQQQDAAPAPAFAGSPPTAPLGSLGAQPTLGRTNVLGTQGAQPAVGRTNLQVLFDRLSTLGPAIAVIVALIFACVVVVMALICCGQRQVVAPYSTVPFGQAPHGHAPHGHAPYGHAPYGRAPYGQF